MADCPVQEGAVAQIDLPDSDLRSPVSTFRESTENGTLAVLTIDCPGREWF